MSEMSTDDLHGGLSDFSHEHAATCDRRDNGGYTPRVGDIVSRCRDTAKRPATWYIDEVGRDQTVRLMPFKNGVPGWWWRTTHINTTAAHLSLIVPAGQEALF